MAYDLSSQTFWDDSGVRFEFHCIEWYLNPDMVGYSYDSHATIVTLSIYSQASCYCGLQGSQLGNAVDYFSFLVVCITLSSSIKGS